ncbi:hypothetical protein LXA43DRAFT_1060711 [Ganoderma leucocontextum]|nr:hypothetical protein LXA43DRAFT_1060711 [Ganoderma leucocontextum]
MAALNKLLALLELGRHGGDPIDNPAPWSWASWMERFDVDGAPWSGPRWRAKTGVSRENWESSRAFVVAYHAAGDNPIQRRYFARGLTEGQIFAGLQLLLEKFEADGLQAEVDEVIEAILEIMGIQTLDKLYAEIYCARASVEHIAWVLFDKDAFEQPSVPHPAVTGWIIDLLEQTMARWTNFHNEIVSTIQRLQNDVYIACKDVSKQSCQAQDITAYLGVLSSLVKQLNFTEHDEREPQLEHYRSLLRAMTDCVNRQASPALCIPPNMNRALRSLPTVQHHEQVKTALLECWNIINIASDRIPDSSSHAVDLYDRLCVQSLALTVGLEEGRMDLEDYIDREGADSPEWGDEERTAFLFAPRMDHTAPQARATYTVLGGQHAIIGSHQIECWDGSPRWQCSHPSKPTSHPEYSTVTISRTNGSPCRKNPWSAQASKTYYLGLRPRDGERRVRTGYPLPLRLSLSSSSPLPRMAALNKLLALLELGRHGGDPIDNPAPWSWGSWMERFQVDRALWSGPRWRAKTGVSRENWESSRAFVVAYHAAGDNPIQRRYFATSLTEGQIFAGLQLLLEKFEAHWLQADVDKVIEAILESMGIQTLNKLYAEIYCARASVENIAWVLFDKDAFEQPSVPHPAVTVWIIDLLEQTMARWTSIHNEIVCTAERLQRDVYIAYVSKQSCQAQDITAYLGVLSSLVKQLTFTVHEGRKQQLEHYRELLYAMAECMNREEPSAPCIPPNMNRALRSLPTVQHHEQVKTALLECWNIVDTAADRIPDSSSHAVDLYDRLCGQTLDLSVGVMEHMYLEADEEQEAEDWLAWEDEDRAAFLFATQRREILETRGVCRAITQQILRRRRVDGDDGARPLAIRACTDRRDGQTSNGPSFAWAENLAPVWSGSNGLRLQVHGCIEKEQYNLRGAMDIYDATYCRLEYTWRQCSLQPCYRQPCSTSGSRLRWTPKAAVVNRAKSSHCGRSRSVQLTLYTGCDTNLQHIQQYRTGHAIPCNVVRATITPHYPTHVDGRRKSGRRTVISRPPMISTSQNRELRWRSQGRSRWRLVASTLALGERACERALVFKGCVRTTRALEVIPSPCWSNRLGCLRVDEHEWLMDDRRSGWCKGPIRTVFGSAEAGRTAMWRGTAWGFYRARTR